MSNILPRILDWGITVRSGAKLRRYRVRVGGYRISRL